MNNLPLCPICNTPLSLRLAQGRKSGKPCVFLLCPQDGRHIRAFIYHKPYVEKVLNKLENHQGDNEGDRR